MLKHSAEKPVRHRIDLSSEELARHWCKHFGVSLDPLESAAGGKSRRQRRNRYERTTLSPCPLQSSQLPEAVATYAVPGATASYPLWGRFLPSRWYSSRAILYGGARRPVPLCVPSMQTRQV